MQSVYSKDPVDCTKGESYLSAENQSVYSTAPVDRVILSMILFISQYHNLLLFDDAIQNLSVDISS